MGPLIHGCFVFFFSVNTKVQYEVGRIHRFRTAGLVG